MTKGRHTSRKNTAGQKLPRVREREKDEKEREREKDEKEREREKDKR